MEWLYNIHGKVVQAASILTSYQDFWILDSESASEHTIIDVTALKNPRPMSFTHLRPSTGGRKEQSSVSGFLPCRRSLAFGFERVAVEQ